MLLQTAEDAVLEFWLRLQGSDSQGLGLACSGTRGAGFRIFGVSSLGFSKTCLFLKYTSLVVELSATSTHNLLLRRQMEPNESWSNSL